KRVRGFRQPAGVQPGHRRRHPAVVSPMQIEPSETAFAERYGRNEPQVVWTTLVADLETAVSAFLKLGGKPMSFLLESVEGGAVRGRYSIIGLDPDVIWRASEGKAHIQPSGGQNPRCLRPLPGPAAGSVACLDRGKQNCAA